MRGLLGSVLAGALLVLPGCGILDAPPGPEVPAGCGDCTDEVASLVAELEESPAVVGVEAAQQLRGGDGHLRLVVDLKGRDVVSADVQALFDGVAEVAWRSRVHPVDSLSVDGRLRNGYGESIVYAFGEQRDSYEARWGPRPSGTTWTPVTQQPEEGEGCRADGCRDLMRAVAREVSALDGVRAVTRSVFLPDTPTNGDDVTIQLEVDPGAAADVDEQVAEIVWTSEVAPLDWIVVEVVRGGELDTARYWVAPDSREHAAYEERWGPRPVG